MFWPLNTCTLLSSLSKPLRIILWCFQITISSEKTKNSTKPYVTPKGKLHLPNCSSDSGSSNWPFKILTKLITLQ